MSTFIDIHVIQTVPPSNINRDDTGSPKSAFFGGVRRVRISSQAWKRATRYGYKDLVQTDDLGLRTKQATELLARRITEKASEVTGEGATERALTVLAALGIKTEKVTSKTRQKAIDAGDAVEAAPATEYLIFWSNRQLDRLAELALSSEKPSKREAVQAADQEHGIDIALFGRMVADDADLNVDAAVQVAHALSTHAAEIEQDYFTAVDDCNVGSNETGAGMIGTVEFNAATLYRYATVNVDGLRHNLADDDEALSRAVEAFARAFILSMPTGKQNTFANRTVPDAVVVAVRTDQPVNLVGAFEKPVSTGSEPHEGGYVATSVRRLVEEAQQVHDFVGAPAAVFTARSTQRGSAVDELATPTTVDALVEHIGEALRGEGGGRP